MRSILYEHYGEPGDVLRLRDVPDLAAPMIGELSAGCRFYTGRSELLLRASSHAAASTTGAQKQEPLLQRRLKARLQAIHQLLHPDSKKSAHVHHVPIHKIISPAKRIRARHLGSGSVDRNPEMDIVLLMEQSVTD